MRAENQLPKCLPPALKRPASIPELNISCKRQRRDRRSKRARGRTIRMTHRTSPLYLGNAQSDG